MTETDTSADLLSKEGHQETRAKLMSFLQRHGSFAPDDEADECFFRLWKAISKGEEIQSVEGFLFGVAKNVRKERARQPRTIILLSDVSADSSSDRAERLDHCLSHCLKNLPPDERKLFLAYHSAEGKNLVELRRSLAERHGLTAEALRLRVHRIRKNLDSCLEKCLKAEPGL